MLNGPADIIVEDTRELYSGEYSVKRLTGQEYYTVFRCSELDECLDKAVELWECLMIERFC